MFRGLAVLSLTAASVFGANVQRLSILPNSATPAAMQLDAAGNIYVAGFFVPTGKNGYSAFVAKLAPGGSQVVYFTAIGGSFNDKATAVALAPDGSAYVAGNTTSFDFPVTAGAMLSTFNGGGDGFLAKVNPAGTVVYATYIGGASSTLITGMTLDRAGDIFLTGTGGPAFPANGSGPPRGFVLELNAALSQVLLSTYGYGGGLISVDSQGNIYLAGNAQPDLTLNLGGNAQPDVALATRPPSQSATLPQPTASFTLPPFPAGAFQPTHPARTCFTFGSGPGGVGGSLTCQYQYVAKLDATGKLLWGTYVTGTYGAIASGMAVDSAGNVIVAGSTYSDDYPVTPGAFQTGYAASAPPYPTQPGNTYSAPPPVTGYVTKVNSTGTGLIWSSYFGGSYAESITGLAMTASGEIVISGYADSTDVPGLAGTPDACRPSPSQLLGFVSRMAPDGTTAGPTQLVQGAPVCVNAACGHIFYTDFPNYPSLGPLAIGANGAVLFATTSGTLAAIDFSAVGRVSCVVDPADGVQLSTVAPGQLVSIFGTDLAPATPFIPPSGVAASTGTFGVFFNGIAAPILYSDGQQINLQVPFEIAGQSSVQMKVVNQQTTLPLSETVTLGVADRQPSIFLSAAGTGTLYPGYILCGGVLAIGAAAITLNADGTLNDCFNPALSGSTVTIILNGLGLTTPALATGAITPAPPVPLTPGVAVFSFGGPPVNLSTLSLPGASTGAAQLRVQLPQGLPRGPYSTGLTLNGTPLREASIVIWTRPN